MAEQRSCMRHAVGGVEVWIDRRRPVDKQVYFVFTLKCGHRVELSEDDEVRVAADEAVVCPLCSVVQGLTDALPC